MTQNLDLDLGTSWPSPAGSDYNVAATAYLPVATASSVTASTISSPSISTRSWSLGDYVITNPETPSDCGHQKNSFADCPAEFTSVVGKTASSDPDFYIKNGKQTVVGNQYDAHYLVGNHYQYNTATAGTGGGIAGDYGNYWSSTAYSDADSAYNLDFSGLTSISPSTSSYRGVGRSVRCVAR